jgi:hypothetical protein
MHSNKETPAEAAIYDCGAYSKMHSAIVRPRTKRVPWEPEEDATILKMRKVDGCSWEEIHAAPPISRNDPSTLLYKAQKVVASKVIRPSFDNLLLNCSTPWAQEYGNCNIIPDIKILTLVELILSTFLLSSFSYLPL